jgi:Na+-translocating ferredoxin:NAD+ oxidoreductase subunit E
MMLEEVKRGLRKENAALNLALGLCPALAVSTSALSALGMGITVIFVLTCSNAFISLISKWIPQRVRVPSYTVVVAAVVVVADSWMRAVRPDVSDRLGIFVPLLAVNCLVLTRAQGYASRNNAVKSAIDGIVTGVGFAAALFVIAAIREFLGNNSLFGMKVIPGLIPITFFSYAPGGFLVLAAVLWIANRYRAKKEGKGR